MQAPAAPGSGEKVDLKELNGALLFINVKALKRDIETSFGTTDAIACDIAVLDGPKKGETIDDALIFPRVLVGQLTSAVGSADPVIVGRLGQGLAKPGKSAPWVLNDPTPDELATASKYEAYAKERALAQSEPF